MMLQSVFNEPYEFPIIDKRSVKMDLTLSVILEKNGLDLDVQKIQKTLLEEIEYSKKIRRGIYMYPKDRVHFSVIALPSLSEFTEDQKNFMQTRKQKTILIKEVLGRYKNFRLRNKTIKFRFVYPRSSQSIAIQAFPSRDILNLFESIKDNLGSNKSLGDIVIKGNPPDKPEYYTVNLVRFFRKPDAREFKLLQQRIADINCKSQSASLFCLTLKHISLVVSDNWLSNPAPEIFGVDLI